MKRTCWSIGEFARRMGVRASALRYYDTIGLLPPESRHPGGRVYGPAQAYRLQVIRLMHEAARMELTEVSEVLDPEHRSAGWHDTVAKRRAVLEQQVVEISRALKLLDHAETCDHRGPFETCPRLAAQVATVSTWFSAETTF